MPSITTTKANKKFSIIIPSAGMGHRMKTKGTKSLIRINNETLINRQIRILSNLYPQAEIIIVVGYESDKIIEQLPKNIKVVENENYESTNVCRSINLGLRITSNNTVLIVFGDLVFNIDTVNHGSGNYLVYDYNNHMKSEEVGMNVLNDACVSLSYGLPEKWSHIMCLKDEYLDTFKQIVSQRKYDNLYCFEAINVLIDKIGPIDIKSNKNMVIGEIDTTKDAKRVIQIFKEQ